MRIQALAGALLIATASFSGGCANDTDFLGGGLTTASIAPASKPAAPKVDPQCVALMSKIDALRKEGTPERIEKVAAGKSKTAVVKRESLQRISELERANAEFQARCSTLTPEQQAAATTSPAAAEAAAQAAAGAGAKQTMVKTVAKPAAKAAASVQ